VAALALKSQRIIVDHEKCIGCGQCLKACPRNLFVLVPFKPKAPIYYVACSNKETVLNVKKVCSRGCIGCGICARVENSPYYLKDNLSCVDPAKAEHRGSLEEGKAKCPTKCIFVGAGHIRSDVEPAAW